MLGKLSTVAGQLSYMGRYMLGADNLRKYIFDFFQFTVASMCGTFEAKGCKGCRGEARIQGLIINLSKTIGQRLGEGEGTPGEKEITFETSRERIAKFPAKPQGRSPKIFIIGSL